jgi:hypothetical protein
MKKLIYGTLFLALVGIGVVGCQKKDVQKKETINFDKDYNLKSSSTNNNSIELSHNQIISIAKLHNEILQNIYQNGSITSEEAKQKMKVYDLNNINNFEILSRPKLNLDYLNNNLKDEISLQYCNQINAAILESVNVEILNDNLSLFRMKVNQDPRNFNKTVVLLLTEVSSKSAEFWSSSTGTTVTGSPTVAGLSPYVRGIIAADGMGAAGAFTGYGLLAGVTGPMGWGALCATVGFSAAWSSMSAL